MRIPPPSDQTPVITLSHADDWVLISAEKQIRTLNKVITSSHTDDWVLISAEKQISTLNDENVPDNVERIIESVLTVLGERKIPQHYAIRKLQSQESLLQNTHPLSNSAPQLKFPFQEFSDPSIPPEEELDAASIFFKRMKDKVSLWDKAWNIFFGKYGLSIPYHEKASKLGKRFFEYLSEKSINPSTNEWEEFLSFYNNKITSSNNKILLEAPTKKYFRKRNDRIELISIILGCQDLNKINVAELMKQFSVIRNIDPKDEFWNDLWNALFGKYLSIKNHLYRIHYTLSTPSLGYDLLQNYMNTDHFFQHSYLFNSVIQKKFEGNYTLPNGDKLSITEEQTAHLPVGTIVSLQMLEKVDWHNQFTPKLQEIVVVRHNSCYLFGYVVECKEGGCEIQINEHEHLLLANHKIGRIKSSCVELSFKQILPVQRELDSIQYKDESPRVVISQIQNFFIEKKEKLNPDNTQWNVAWNYLFAKYGLRIDEKLFCFTNPSIGYYLFEQLCEDSAKWKDFFKYHTTSNHTFIKKRASLLDIDKAFWNEERTIEKGYLYPVIYNDIKNENFFYGYAGSKKGEDYIIKWDPSDKKKVRGCARLPVKAIGWLPPIYRNTQSGQKHPQNVNRMTTNIFEEIEIGDMR